MEARLFVVAETSGVGGCERGRRAYKRIKEASKPCELKFQEEDVLLE